MEEDLNFSQNSEINATESTTFYKIASDAMKNYIEIYLGLSKQSNGFSNIQNINLTSRNSRLVVIHGLSLELDPDTSTSEEIKREAERILAVNFDTESAITAGVYEKMRFFAKSLVENLFKETDNLKFLPPEYLLANPGLLPLFQQLAGLRSKSELLKWLINFSIEEANRKNVT
jgi:hypothetical protein